MSIISKVGVFLVIVLSSIYIYSALRGPQGLPAVFGTMEEIRAFQRKNAELKHEVEEREKRIERLRVSKSEQELEIRKRMKLVHPGETVFIITGKPIPKNLEPANRQQPAVDTETKPATPPVTKPPQSE